MFEAVVSIAIGLFFFAAIGHGLWLLGAAIVRGLARLGGTAPEAQRPRVQSPAPPTTHCPRCRTELRCGRRQCGACGWPEPAPSAEKQRELALDAVLRRARRFHSMGWLDLETLKRVELSLEGTLPVAEAVAEPKLAETPPDIAPEPVVDAIPLAEVRPPEPEPFVEASAPQEPTVEPTAAPSPPAPLPQCFLKTQERVDTAAPPPPSPPRVPTPPPAPRFASFLEEKNIRWGELVGGLLILCSSIALVLSFWQQISERPLLKFGLFNGVTAALFAIGLYVERRWRLPTTTHGVLLIALLLVPLNFLAVAAFTLNSPPTDALTIGGELLSICLFLWLAWRSAVILMPSVSVAAALAVVGCAAWQLVVRRFAWPDSSYAVLAALGLAPIVAYVWPIIAAIRRFDKQADFGERGANELFRIIGTTLFAAVLPLGLILAKSEHAATTLARLAPLAALLGAPLLAAGMFLWRKLSGDEVLKERIAGTAIAVAGALGMGAASALAWPIPAGMVPTAVVNALVFTWVAWRSAIPAAHLLAALSLAGAYLIGVRVLEGSLLWELNDARLAVQVLVSGWSGTLLVAPAILFALPALLSGLSAALIAPALKNRGLRHWYALAAGLCAAVSTALVAYFGNHLLGDPYYGTFLFALYGAGALVAAARIDKPALGYVGSALLMASALFGLCLRYDLGGELTDDWLYAALLHALVTIATALVLDRRGLKFQAVLCRPLIDGAAWSSIAAAALVGVAVARDHHWHAAIGATGVAFAWGLLLVRSASREWFAAFQFAGFAAAAQWAYVFLRNQDWFAGIQGYPPLVNPRSIAILGLSFTAVCAAWLIVQIVALRSNLSSVWKTLLLAPASIDRAVAKGLVVVVLGLALYGVGPGVLQELSFRTHTPPDPRVVPPLALFEVDGIPHREALGALPWSLWGAVFALALAGMWERFSRSRVATLVVLGMASSFLIAAPWETEVAAASALRWTSAAALVVMSLPIWLRRPLGRLIDRLRWPYWSLRSPGLARDLFRQVLLATLAAPVAMIVGLGFAAVARYDRLYWAAPNQESLAYPDDLLVGFYTCAFLALTSLAGCAAIRALGRKFAGEKSQEWLRLASTVVALLGSAPLVVLVIYWQAVALKLSPILGPEPTSWFVRVGLAVSYAVPLGLTAATIVGHAVSFRSPRLAVASSLVLNFTATLAYVLALVPQGLQFDGALWLRVGQLNAAVTALFGLVWMGARQALGTGRQALEGEAEGEGAEVEGAAAEAAESPRLRFGAGIAPAGLTLQVALAAAIALTGVVGSIGGLFSVADAPERLSAAISDAWAWGALAIAFVCVAAYFRSLAKPIPPGVWTCAALAVVSLSAFHARHWDDNDFFTVRVFLSAWTAVALGALFAGIAAAQSGRFAFGPPQAVARWATFVVCATLAGILAATILTVGAIDRPEATPILRIYQHIELMLAAVLVIAGAWVASHKRLYFAALLLIAIALYWWGDVIEPWWFPQRWTGDEVWWLVWLIAASLPTPLWVWIDRKFIAPRTDVKQSLPPLGSVTALGSLAAVGAITFYGLVHDATREANSFPGSLVVAAAAAMFVAVASCLWNASARWAAAALYCAGLTLVGVALDQRNLEPRMLAWWGATAIAGYALATSAAWHQRSALARLNDLLRLPQRFADEHAGAVWIVPANLLLAAIVVPPALWCATHLDGLGWRLGAGAALVLGAISVGLMAQRATGFWGRPLIRPSDTFSAVSQDTVGRRGDRIRELALDYGVLAVVALAWAWLTPTPGGFFGAGEFLNRAVLCAAALAGMVAVYGVGFAKLFRTRSAWTDAAEAVTAELVVVAGLALAVVLSAEAYEYWKYDGVVRIAGPAIAAVAVALVALFAACLVAALVPGRDPLGLSERGRTAYIYAAEVILALLFMHVRLTMPWLFRGYFAQFWPIIVMLIAYVGVGLGEVFHRTKRRVLSEPLERTGALLPLLPVFGFWVTDTSVHYSLLLLSVGGLYAALAVLRKSFGFGILATLAANGGLWYFLEHQEGLSWIEHPQLWLIPPALCVLIAGHLNRNRMTREQATGLRYFAAGTIYVSSTADVFLNGVAEAPYLPLVLGALALGGVFAGIALRVRPFLYMGTTFLVLALTTVIWHAGFNENRTWIFYVTGIVVGVAIIALFAVFEKKRQELLGVVERLREWE